MNALLELADRCEKAEGPDRELDMAICLALDTGRRVSIGPDGGGRWHGPDHFTASLDAAMTLVPEGCDFGVFRVGGKVDAECGPTDTFQTYNAGGLTPTPALALCAAALRARAAQ